MENPRPSGDCYVNITIYDFYLCHNRSASSITLRAARILRGSPPALAWKNINQFFWWRWGWGGWCRRWRWSRFWRRRRRSRWGWLRRWRRLNYRRRGRWGDHGRCLGRLSHRNDRRGGLNRHLHFGRRYIGRRRRHDLRYFGIRRLDFFRRRWRWRGRGRGWNDHLQHHDGFKRFFQEFQAVAGGTGDQGPGKQQVQCGNADQTGHLARRSFGPLDKTHGRQLTGQIVRCRSRQLWSTPSAWWLPSDGQTTRILSPCPDGCEFPVADPFWRRTVD
jgi:hypothetical protein